jgi:transcriptional regulator with XRE-family HTH domain
MNLSNNLRFLRMRRQRTQDVVANDLGVTRSTLNNYESGAVVNPTLELLVRFSKYFKVSIDTLVKIDLTKLGESQLSELERGNDVYITGSRLRVLATTIDSMNKENIELVNHKARAGYRSGYADPDFIKKLPTFQLPILFNDRKYRMFQVSGDSMNPIPDKSWVIGEYLENWYDIKDGQAYIILTVDDGIVFKLVNNHLRKKKSMELVSLNEEYKPYEVHANEVKEVWKFCNYISDEIPSADLNKTDLVKAIQHIEQKVMEVRKHLATT